MLPAPSAPRLTAPESNRPPKAQRQKWALLVFILDLNGIYSIYSCFVSCFFTQLYVCEAVLLCVWGGRACACVQLRLVTLTSVAFCVNIPHCVSLFHSDRRFSSSYSGTVMSSAACRFYCSAPVWSLFKNSLPTASFQRCSTSLRSLSFTVHI